MFQNRGMKYGCVRVSTEDQNPALQIAALKKAGCQRVFKGEPTEAATKRPALPQDVAGWDTLIVWKLDRLARNLPDLVKHARWLPPARHTFPLTHRGNQHQHSVRQADFSYLRRPCRI
jgi:DNA invertase Pin-like site-specific DNA recombinase